MGVVAWILVIAWLSLAAIIVYLAITRTPVFAHERIADHIPDPRDAEIAFLRDRVTHLETMLHRTSRDYATSQAELLRDALVGRPTGLPSTDDLDDGGGSGTVLDDDGGFIEDWTDGLFPPGATEKVPPPPEGFDIP